jgi:hypothetical protein
MAALASDLRRQLEAVIVSARAEAEVAAKAALEALAIHHHEPFSSMTPEDRDLRTRLRAHARQLGDTRDVKKGTQAIDRLIAECAYEHWHRMLFARFLAENDLLIEPESGVAVSLEDCKELAREKGDDPWALASRFAQRMLPQIFRPEDPILQVALSREYQSRLESLLEKIPSVSFKEDDSLGWVYQFWQSKRKDEVNAAGGKIGADELAPVTQLFTEHYMVLFLLHNTVGAWYAGKVLERNLELARTAGSEEELRAACAIPGYQWEYLRFVREGEDVPWRPAAGTFEKWSTTAKEITVMDPCCGSGHFLVAVFDCLVHLRMAEEGFSLEEAIRAVLAKNILGLELDSRCTQLAAFALAFAAWKFVGRVIPLPSLNVACTGLAVGVDEEEWTTLAGDDVRLKKGMALLHTLFKQGPELGSLIDPKRALPGELFSASFGQLKPFFEKALAAETGRADADTVEVGVAAKGMVQAAELLSGAYTLVITNVPYLAGGKQDKVLKEHINTFYTDGKADLATAFVLRSMAFLSSGGSLAAVTPQNWLFLTTYRKLRERLLKNTSWEVIARLGAGAFETIGGEVVNVFLLILSNLPPNNDNAIAGIDVSSSLRAIDKADNLLSSSINTIDQGEILSSSQSIVAFGSKQDLPTLGSQIITGKGICTGDSLRFIHNFWEHQSIEGRWRYFRTSVNCTIEFSGCEFLLLWDYGSGELYKFVEERLGGNVGAWIRGKDVWGKKGISVSRVSGLAATFYFGELFDDNAASIVPIEESMLPALWCYAKSGEFEKDVRKINSKLSIDNTYLGLIGFDRNRWKSVAIKEYPEGLPKPYSGDPTQWLFHGHPLCSTTPLHVAVARLLGYRWPAELDEDMELSSEARKLIRSTKDLLSFVDDDGIICLPPVRGESFASERLRALLAKTFGSGWTPTKERELIAQTGSSAESLDGWLRDDFFAQHYALFHHRPFVWHIWDGRKDGFHALVNYHKLAEGEGKGRRLLESLTYSYLGDWITRQKAAVQDGEAGADGRLAAAMELQGQLTKILEGESPYDLFVRWKPLHQQPIGWDPDINDGVRINIRPFMTATLSKGKAGAGILRAKPNIKWGEDRGNEPYRMKENFPWFWDRSTFTGDRLNDCHYSNAEKQVAREKRAGASA